jgi:hypothetical protein
MKEYAEFRVPENYAKEFLPADLGKNITDSVRKVRVPVKSNVYEKIGEFYRLVESRDQKSFFFGWQIQRIYSQKELESAELLLLKTTKTFEPAGLECGTIYNNQNICDICGTGIQQMSELILDLNTVPKNVDIARTISDEIVLSQELAELLVDNKISGYELEPVHHKSAKYHRRPWYQLLISSLVNINHATKTGIHPFDEDNDGKHRCKNGHTIGLNILSELSINKATWDGSDIVATKELLGVNRGLLRTYPLIVISQRLYRLMKQKKSKGFSTEIVHLVG